MDKDELLERYEALGQEDDFLAARRLFEQDLSGQEIGGQSGAVLLRQFGYLLECHGRYTLRRAVEQYERAIALDPDADKVRYQWMSAKAALGEADDAVTLHRQRVAASDGDVRELRFLSAACVMAKDFSAASEVIEAGLRLAPEDWKLLSDRGEVKAATGDPDDALADWRRALELDPADLSPVYSSAILLERAGRLAEAAESWRYIAEYCDAHGWELTAAWPRQEFDRIRGLLGQH